MNPNRHAPKVVVSMTSFPAAIPYATQAVQSILNGSVLPDKVVLYLTFLSLAMTVFHAIWWNWPITILF